MPGTLQQGLAPKPMAPAPPRMPPPAAAGGAAAAAGMAPPRAPAMSPPGQVGLNRPAFGEVQLQRPVRPAPGPAAGSTIELRRPEAPAQQQQQARTDIGFTRPPAQTEEEKKQLRATGRLGRIEVVVEDEDAELDEDEDDDKKKKKKRGKREKVTAEMKRAARKQREAERKREKVTAEMKRAARKQREAEREEKAASQRREKEEIFEVGEEGMSLEALADAIQVEPSEIMRTLFMKGIMLSMNQVLDKNTVKLVAGEYDLLVVDKAEAGVTAGAVKQTEFLKLEDLDDAVPRPPVVTVMGHVDHGKTSLLDFIRKAKVAAGEAGGITQAIGAYNVEVEVDGDSKTICFLDTPGHEAFSAMRARGARVTDIAIIIVAADDGVQPQTREAVSHAQAADVPIIVAINKIDKPGADVERAKQSLLELNLVPEEWGGNTPMVPISAKKGTGIDDLLQAVAWVAEEKQLMANATKLAAGTVIEAHLDKKRGAVATLLVQAGTLRTGDIVSCGACCGKVRSLTNSAGRPVGEAGPSIAVQLIGLNAVPNAGDEFQAHTNDSDARKAADAAGEGLRAARIAEMSTTGSMVTLSSLATFDEDTDTLQRMNLIIKGDTSGVVEAIKGALQGLPQESVVLRYLLCAAGDITTSDVDLAAASSGMVVGFNLNPDEAVLSHAKRLGVTINTYKVIYNLIDDVKAAMEGKLRTIEERQPLGTATVKAVFGSGKKKVAGVVVDEGKLQKGAQMEVTRGKDTIVYTGKVASLRRIKDNVEEVQVGLECGVGADEWTSWQEGDVIKCYMVVTKSQRLEEARAATAVDVNSL
ncbi:hypothetical protein OEZ86_010304 [Tetradesmus obliquus]|nr:hypothetical protein OEZ86_010304 [Tetradesmus obliquus]